MSQLPLSAALTCCTVLLTSCVQPEQGTPPLVVNVKGDGETCRVTVQGERVTSDRLLEIGRSAPKRRSIVLHDKDTPYKCIGATIYTLQRAGLTTVDAAMWDGG